MKKLLKILAVGALSFSLFGGVAAAATCTITNGNGTGSTNTCTISESFKVSVTCSNGINASFSNSQHATSGDATANGNTIVSNVSSGDADNAASFANELSAFCLAAAPTPEPEPTPTPTPSNPQVQGQSTTVAALPKTGESSLLSGAVMVTAAAVAAAVLSKLSLLAYAKIRK